MHWRAAHIQDFLYFSLRKLPHYEIAKCFPWKGNFGLEGDNWLVLTREWSKLPLPPSFPHTAQVHMTIPSLCSLRSNTKISSWVDPIYRNMFGLLIAPPPSQSWKHNGPLEFSAHSPASLHPGPGSQGRPDQGGQPVVCGRMWFASVSCFEETSYWTQHVPLKGEMHNIACLSAPFAYFKNHTKITDREVCPILRRTLAQWSWGGSSALHCAQLTLLESPVTILHTVQQVPAHNAGQHDLVPHVATTCWRQRDVQQP